MLMHIHPLDFEKIKYTCSWLINMLELSAEEVPDDGKSSCRKREPSLNTVDCGMSLASGHSIIDILPALMH